VSLARILGVDQTLLEESIAFTPHDRDLELGIFY
jgi:hypothetical protein